MEIWTVLWYGSGGHRYLHVGSRRQRQMCRRDGGSGKPLLVSEAPASGTAEANLGEGARSVVGGKAFDQWPEGLYIPPEALEVVLEGFEGPLDLLLHLIRRQNIDILDLPVADITRQYMHYIELMLSLIPI